MNIDDYIKMIIDGAEPLPEDKEVLEEVLLFSTDKQLDVLREMYEMNETILSMIDAEMDNRKSECEGCKL